MTPERANPTPIDPTGSEFEPRAGDVILIDHGEDGGPVSRLIQRVTDSPWSHTILVLAPDLFTDAFEGPTGPFVERGADIETWGPEAGWLDKATCDLFRLPATRPAPDLAVMKSTVETFVGRATPIPKSPAPGNSPDGGATPIIEFDTGDLAGLAILRGLMQLERAPGRDADDREAIVKFRRATFKALNNGDTRLFCSEYVYRVLTVSGARPQLGDRPFIPVDGYRTDESGIVETDLFGALARWLRSVWDSILEFVEGILALPAQGLEIGDVIARIRAAYDDPSPDPVLERANFVVPGDFVIDRIHVATRTEGSGAWGPPILRQPGPSAG